MKLYPNFICDLKNNKLFCNFSVHVSFHIGNKINKRDSRLNDTVLGMSCE